MESFEGVLKWSKGARCVGCKIVIMFFGGALTFTMHVVQGSINGGHKNRMHPIYLVETVLVHGDDAQTYGGCMGLVAISSQPSRKCEGTSVVS